MEKKEEVLQCDKNRGKGSSCLNSTSHTYFEIFFFNNMYFCTLLFKVRTGRVLQRFDQDIELCLLSG